MLRDEVVIHIAQVTDAPALTELGMTTFCEAYAEFNTKENMDSYVTQQLNL